MKHVIFRKRNEHNVLVEFVTNDILYIDTLLCLCSLALATAGMLTILVFLLAPIAGSDSGLYQLLNSFVKPNELAHL